MHKKGFTLIELSVILCVSALIFCTQINVLVRDVKSFKRDISFAEKYCSMQQALNIIDNLISNKNSVLISNNEILIDNKLDGKSSSKFEKIVLLNDKIEIKYYDFSKYNFKLTRNIICKNIKNFYVKRFGKVLYIKLINSEKGECERFIPIQN